MSETEGTKLAKAGEAKERPGRGPRGQVVVYNTWCKGCGLCVAFCPVDVLGLDADGHPVVVAPEKCTACRWCEFHCPDFAIMVKPNGGE